jgi:uncharacterized membrane protein
MPTERQDDTAKKPLRQHIRSVSFDTANALAAGAIIMFFIDSGRDIMPILILLIGAAPLYLLACWIGWRR